ncbi:hypothetical protein LshimejAT787_1100500 [Lyophyllum shimeji]|uniref:Uncharacterized protein n=1 Tax=Lyophyllum shimeji TaxID=47721 RepID=A0A9P3PU59_LYOSH|nr:hypothetical protein LshimejAT787_1100500 [Lyophyllum shimeji]
MDRQDCDILARVIGHIVTFTSVFGLLTGAGTERGVGGRVSTGETSPPISLARRHNIAYISTVVWNRRRRGAQTYVWCLEIDTNDLRD